MPEPVRPDPDALLARLRGETARAARSRLRIHSGANAGVGRTRAMLVAARRGHAPGGFDLDAALADEFTRGRSGPAGPDVVATVVP